jgi:hypothetical protein
MSSSDDACFGAKKMNAHKGNTFEDHEDEI